MRSTFNRNRVLVKKQEKWKRKNLRKKYRGKPWKSAYVRFRYK